MAGGTRFEMTEFYISEVGNAVFQEIEERHYRGDEFIRKNVIAVYRFNDRQQDRPSRYLRAGQGFRPMDHRSSQGCNRGGLRVD